MITQASSISDLGTQNPELTVVDFHRNGCHYCDMLAPVLDDLAYDLPFVRICKINCSDVPDAAKEFDVQAFPTVKVFRAGKVLDSIVGFTPLESLRERIGAELYS